MEGMSLALTVLLTGIIVVFFALVILILFIKGYGTIISKIQSQIKKKKEDAVQSFSVVEESTFSCNEEILEPEIPNEVIAAISAAIYSIYNCQPKIHSVKRIRNTSARPRWGSAGILENTRPF